MTFQSKKALDQFLEVIKNADKTFLDPDKNIDEQGKVDGYQHIFHLLRTASASSLNWFFPLGFGVNLISNRPSDSNSICV